MQKMFILLGFYEVKDKFFDIAKTILLFILIVSLLLALFLVSVSGESQLFGLQIRRPTPFELQVHYQIFLPLLVRR